VVSVVPSQEEFETFPRDQLLHATQQVGDSSRQLTFFLVYKIVEQ
jgi:hypothetical protein